MNIEAEFLSYSEAETEAFAGRLAAAMPDGGVVALHGDLGAGKTVFARGFARQLGIREPVSSPTYTILQEYAIPGGGEFHHLDCYRLDSPAAALAFGLDEYFDRTGSHILVEWPERIDGLLPPGTLHVEILHAGDDVRHLKIGREPHP